MDKETAVYGVIATVAVAFLGKWLVPLIMRVLENSLAGANAAGGILATVIAERDQWRLRYEASDNALQEMRKEWAAMRSDFGRLQYQLREARERIASLTGEPLPPEEREIDQAH